MMSRLADVIAGILLGGIAVYLAWITVRATPLFLSPWAAFPLAGFLGLVAFGALAGAFRDALRRLGAKES